MSAVTVDFWNVGFGDASVIHLGQNRVAVIDCGPVGCRLAQWLEKYGKDISVLLLTHNDTDHAGGLYSLLSRVGHKVTQWAWLQDRPAKDLRKQVMWLQEGAPERWPVPRLIDAPQVFIEEGGNLPVRLEAIYPDSLELLDAQRKKPNKASALLVLFVAGRACVAWPGDLPIEIARESLQTAGLEPMFVVGPHHGAPEGWESQDLRRWVEEIGHTQLWVSVSWRSNYKCPRGRYLNTSRDVGVTVRCSQVTPRCDAQFVSNGADLLPTHEWLNLFPPRKRRPACMGPMRVVFRGRDVEICYEAEHAAAVQRLSHPCCV